MYGWNEPLGGYYTEEEIIRDIDTYYDFANEVFELLVDDMYGNVDWINITLIISPEFMTSTKYGAVYGEWNGGIIRLYLYAILKRVPKAMACTIIITTLVHELKHAGQVVKFKCEFDSEQDYINAIERPVEWETLMYMSEHREWLEEKLGIGINLMAFKRYQMKYAAYNTQMYVPATPESHWMNILMFIYGTDANMISRIIQNNSLTKENTIVLHLVNEGPETPNYYSHHQFIKKNGVFDYPDGDLIDLAYNLSSVRDLEFDVSTGWNESCYIIESKYSISNNCPIIRYDKPCTT